MTTVWIILVALGILTCGVALIYALQHWHLKRPPTTHHADCLRGDVTTGSMLRGCRDVFNPNTNCLHALTVSGAAGNCQPVLPCDRVVVRGQGTVDRTCEGHTYTATDSNLTLASGGRTFRFHVMQTVHLKTGELRCFVDQVAITHTAPAGVMTVTAAGFTPDDRLHGSALEMSAAVNDVWDVWRAHVPRGGTRVEDDALPSAHQLFVRLWTVNGTAQHAGVYYKDTLANVGTVDPAFNEDAVWQYVKDPALATVAAGSLSTSDTVTLNVRRTGTNEPAWVDLTPA
jgi:hypothetical protein